MIPSVVEESTLRSLPESARYLGLPYGIAHELSQS